MRKLLAALSLTASIALLVAPAAFAGQEIGDLCVADDSESDWTLIVLDSGPDGGGLPTVVPLEGQGVITRWKVVTEPGTPPTQQQLVASRPVGNDEDVLVGESAVETVVAGTNEFATRIPVPGNAHIGLRGPVETLFCDKLDGHLGGIVDGPWPLGGQRAFEVAMGLGVPVAAVVEPDADGDGYGDETQDGCASDPAIQSGSCGGASLSGRAKRKRRAILVWVGVDRAASVKVFGQVRWGLRRPNGKQVKLTQGLGGGAERTLLPGTPRRFRVPLPRTVLRRLGRIEPSQRLTAHLYARATTPAGVVTQRHFKLRLPGRG